MSPNDRSSESGLRDYCKAEFFNTIDQPQPFDAVEKVGLAVAVRL